MKYCSHFPCGSVDWNSRSSAAYPDRSPSLPLRKCGLKFKLFGRNSTVFCHFPCGSVDWNWFAIHQTFCSRRHFPCGSVDWNMEKNQLIDCRVKSLPLRKCGLKYPVKTAKTAAGESLPLRKCGLKYLIESICIDWYSVTSLAEVWIEISQSFRHIHPVHVTSLAEVWIEIWIHPLPELHWPSLPLRKCGLKFQASDYARKWPSSLPLRKCGLKSAFSSAKKERERSLPLRKCGLKSAWIATFSFNRRVTSLAEVWIEIVHPVI